MCLNIASNLEMKNDIFVKVISTIILHPRENFTF